MALVCFCVLQIITRFICKKQSPLLSDSMLHWAHPSGAYGFVGIFLHKERRQERTGHP